MIPPASIATKKSASAITPGTRYCMKSLCPYTSTRSTWTPGTAAVADAARGPIPEANAARSSPSMTAAEVLSVLSTTTPRSAGSPRVKCSLNPGGTTTTPL